MADVYFQKMTPEGHQQIVDEIEALKADRPAKIKQLQEARALGDLSENAEYSAAKRDLRHLESRLRYLNKQLQYAQVIEPEDNGEVDIGTDVELRFADDNETETYHIVGKQEANVDEQKISFDSPIGRAIMHQKAGTIVDVVAPASSYQVTIIKVSVNK
ncbi:transcription elongation factor GreA [Ligilactobacillus aviarius]|uniref:transcription elongation factor GreA n=1 Tax=Ligilactobacillus aviarius TaxID=1606 RepID=UPI0024B891E9|nr:transcription elongation factor GreA [Ligilactobacillus aviarius]